MKRVLPTYLAIAGLAVLLAVLGVLQYRWQRQISQADLEKARAHVHEQTDHFAMDFNREIQNAYFNFQTGADVYRDKNWGPFNERYDYWKSNAAYPQLISGFYFFEGDKPALKYDPASRSFATGAETAETKAVRRHIADEHNFSPVDTSSYTLLLPIPDIGKKVERLIVRTPIKEEDQRMPMPPPRFGYLAIMLNETTVKSILTDLKTKYFADAEYNIAVADKTGQAVYQTVPGGEPDAADPLFDLSPDNFIFYANKDLMSTIGTKRRESMVINSHVETHSVPAGKGRPGEPKGEVKLEFQRSGESRPRTSVFTTNTDLAGGQPWTLMVQHSSGSLDAYAASTLRRNLAIGFGLLFLLAAAIAGIVFSSLRSRRLARRQLEFVSSVSHEFRTPLAVIYSAGENLADGVAKDISQVSRYGDLIKAEGRKLTAMVEQILDYAGAKSGRQKFSFSQATVSEIVEAAVADCKPLIEEKGIEIETSVPDGLSVINADKVALSQAIQNLIANSVKYGNGNAWLRVAAANGNGSVKITVEDRGIGISKSDLCQIFQPFFRSKQVVDAQIHGNGLGLSLVKQIVVAHGGSISATSEIGKGSKFTIELPQK